MDNTTPPADLLTAALARLKAHGITATVEAHEVRLRKTRADALVRIGYGGREVTYTAELKRGLRPNALGAVIHQVERLGEQGLLVADYVTPPWPEAPRPWHSVHRRRGQCLSRPTAFAGLGQGPEACAAC
jgi:hypothetical protein